jgi:putative phage-type endonuclease
MRLIDCEQGSDEWLEARLGIPSASNFAKILTIKGTPSTQAKSYVDALVAEAITGESTYVKVTDAMQRGTELEPYARDRYILETGNEVQEVGFCLHDDYQAGASPDGLIGEDGGLEIKCPLGGTMVSYLRGEKLPSKYYQQVQGSLYITGRKFWDFMAYHPDMKPLIIRVERDENFISILDETLRKVVNEIETLVERYSEE